MEPFFPFIHTPERKKKELEPQPLYIELYPPTERPQKKKEEKEDEQRGVIIIEL